MVIGVLAIIWVVCLTPMLLRRLSEHRLTSSVDSFHRQLRGLRRAYPRLAVNAVEHEEMLYTYVMPAVVPTASTQPPIRMRQSSAVARPASRAQLQAARRRHVLVSLVATMSGCFVLGMIPALRVLWGLSLLAFAAAAGYLALLIYIHRRAVERRVKVVDIRDLRRDALGTFAVSDVEARLAAATRRRAVEDMEWREDELLAYEYDEMMAGGR